VSATDDLGSAVAVPARVRRVVSLVPSLTESVAASNCELLVGATDWCTHPAGLDVERIGGTKNPSVPHILRLQPDMVLANEEENRPQDLEALRASGVAVWTTKVRSVAEAFTSLDRMLTVACRLSCPAWLTGARSAWKHLPDPLSPNVAVVPIWRRPWMAVGSATFTGDVLARLGVRNVLAGASARYPRFSLDALPAPQQCPLVVLPDEPYRFTRDDGPAMFPGRQVALVSGRHLTWYGPSLGEAPAVLGAQLAAAFPGG
jgi:ABC-type Fe3+-hydroxamate transport system substrate-binding protein